MSLILKGINIEKYSQAVIIHPSGKVYKYDGGWRIDNNSPYQAIQIPKGHGRLIDANKLEAMMYHEAFEIDSDLQKWDSGCWIRYKVFENCIINKLLPDTILEVEAEI